MDADARRLMWVMREIDGFVGVYDDKYNFAMAVAHEHGREEPTLDDELEGIRRLIDAAMHTTASTGWDSQSCFRVGG